MKSLLSFIKHWCALPCRDARVDSLALCVDQLADHVEQIQRDLNTRREACQRSGQDLREHGKALNRALDVVRENLHTLIEAQAQRLTHYIDRSAATHKLYDSRLEKLFVKTNSIQTDLKTRKENPEAIDTLILLLMAHHRQRIEQLLEEREIPF